MEAERKLHNDLVNRMVHEGGLSVAEACDLIHRAPVAEWVAAGVDPCDVAPLWRRGLRKTETALRRSEELQEWRDEQRVEEEARRRYEREIRERQRERARTLEDDAQRIRRSLLEVSVGHRSTRWVHLTLLHPTSGLAETLCGITDRVVYPESASAKCPVCLERRNDSTALVASAERLAESTHTTTRPADSEDYG